jgi:hypothetical protein
VGSNTDGYRKSKLFCVINKIASKIDDLPELFGPTRKVNGARGICSDFGKPLKFLNDKFL